MKKISIVAGIVAFAVIGLPLQALAQGKGHGGGMGRGHANAHGEFRGHARANLVANPRSANARALARARDAKALDFCPPGQRKKPGLGSRFQC